ncbi:Armadillo-type fold domain containing protein [Dorcoceras hygrometricum]|uniref:Armadillo-type fold domain containing protein n=1 Tax=Dorcoceras hygrometricum TaxID=472368 RepID=A0A2Z7AX69_9LAMI|nr:Armadillo-type fold domain containing protein [Dorcoceras hygrometricum]
MAQGHARGRDKRGAPSPSCAIAWRTSVGHNRATAPSKRRTAAATRSDLRTPIARQDLEYTKAYVRCDSGYDGYHETHLIVAVYSEHVPSRLGRQNEDKAARESMHRCRGFTARRHAWISYAIRGDNSVQISGQSTRSVLGKCVYLVTLAMSLFDLQDVCIAIGSLATLDLPMVVDLIEIYGLKGPYCTLTTTDWFLQALSVIPRGSWGDVARRFTMIRWARLLVQPDEGVSDLVVDRIGVSTAIYREEPGS